MGKKRNIKGRKEGGRLHDEMQLKRKRNGKMKRKEESLIILQSIRERYADHILPGIIQFPD